MTRLLLSKGYEIVGFDSDLYNGCYFGSSEAVSIPNIRKDIRDVEASDLRGFDAVIHLAGLSNDPLGYFDPYITDQINFEASVKLATLSKKVKVQRFLFSSSCSIYGAAREEMVDEKSKPHPITPYGRSKIQAEKVISKLADHNFHPTFLRSATAYGVSPKLRFDLVLNNLVAWAYTTGGVFLKSDGNSWRPIVHIEDISRAFMAVLNAPLDLVSNEVFNVGITEENYQIRELAEIVKDTVPRSHITYATDAGPDKRSYRVDCRKLTNTIKEYQPQWNARKGAKQLYDAYKAVGLQSTEEFEGPRYKRLKHLKQLISTGQLNSNLRWEKIQPS
jgi:nucleoside-diphosphate-sugar epimerase